LSELVQQGNVLACCPINVAEIYAGMRPKEEVQTTRFLTSLDYYPITFSVARLAGELKSDFGKKGTTLSVADSLIAAVAIEYQLSLLTDNTKDFPMKDLQLYHPLGVSEEWLLPERASLRSEGLHCFPPLYPRFFSTSFRMSSADTFPSVNFLRANP